MAWPASTGGHEMSCQICCRALGPERMWAGVGQCPARSELMATRRAMRIGDETLLTRAGGVPRVGMGGAGCRDRGLGGLVAGWDARVLTASATFLKGCI